MLYNEMLKSARALWHLTHIVKVTESHAKELVQAEFRLTNFAFGQVYAIMKRNTIKWNASHFREQQRCA